MVGIPSGQSMIRLEEVAPFQRRERIRDALITFVVAAIMSVVIGMSCGMRAGIGPFRGLATMNTWQKLGITSPICIIASALAHFAGQRWVYAPISDAERYVCMHHLGAKEYLNEYNTEAGGITWFAIKLDKPSPINFAVREWASVSPQERNESWSALDMRLVMKQKSSFKKLDIHDLRIRREAIMVVYWIGALALILLVAGLLAKYRVPGFADLNIYAKKIIIANAVIMGVSIGIMGLYKVTGRANNKLVERDYSQLKNECKALPTPS